MTKQIIKHEDIQAGDTIRVEWESLESTYARTVIVDYKGESGVWRTKGGFVIYARGKGYTIYLVNRPMQPLPTEPGSVILVTETLGEACRPFYATLDCNGRWFYIPGGFRYNLGGVTGWKEAKLVTVEDETE